MSTAEEEQDVMMGSSSLPMLKECCCGCSLKTGSMIIGYISLLSSIFLTSIAVYSLQHDKYVILKDDSFIDTVLQVFILSVRVVQIFGSLLLIVATHREQAVLVIPWLTVALVVVFLEGASLIAIFCHLAIGEYNKRVFSMTTNVSVTIYFIFVVFSYYREVNGKPRSTNNTYSTM